MNTPAPAPADDRESEMHLDSNLPPVGDIKLSKVNGTFNTYKLELSMGQIEAIRDALEKDHSNPISDELLALFTYYIEKVPGPGEEKEDIEKREKHPGMAADEEGDFPIPMPPREGAATGEEPPTPTGEMASGALEEPPPAEGGEHMPMPEPGAGEEGMDNELDQRLAAPPHE